MIAVAMATLMIASAPRPAPQDVPALSADDRVLAGLAGSSALMTLSVIGDMPAESGGQNAMQLCVGPKADLLARLAAEVLSGLDSATREDVLAYREAAFVPFAGKVVNALVDLLARSGVGGPSLPTTARTVAGAALVLKQCDLLAVDSEAG